MAGIYFICQHIFSFCNKSGFPGKKSYLHRQDNSQPEYIEPNPGHTVTQEMKRTLASGITSDRQWGGDVTKETESL